MILIYGTIRLFFVLRAVLFGFYHILVILFQFAHLIYRTFCTGYENAKAYHEQHDQRQNVRKLPGFYFWRWEMSYRGQSSSFFIIKQTNPSISSMNYKSNHRGDCLFNVERQTVNKFERMLLILWY